MKVKKILLLVAMFSFVFSSVCFGEGEWWQTYFDCSESYFTAYAHATSASTWYGYSWPIDRIKARARLYISSYFANSCTDDNSHSSYAACGTSATIGCGDDFMYSNHTFEQSGYNSWYPEGYYDCNY